MVLTDKLKKPHPYFGAPQSAKADGKDPFIHLRKKRSYLDRFFYSLFFIHGAISMCPRSILTAIAPE